MVKCIPTAHSKRAKSQHKHATKKIDFITKADRLRMPFWSINSHKADVVKWFTCPIVPLTATKEHNEQFVCVNHPYICSNSNH